MERKVMLGAAAVLIVAALVGAALWGSLTAGELGGDKDDKGTETVTVTDMFGRNVTVPNKVDRVVCLNAAALRFVVYIDATSKVVGVEDVEKKTGATDISGRSYRAAHPELADLPSVGPMFGGDRELIAAASPQVIFRTASQASDLDDLQKALGIPVVGLTSNVDLSTNILSFYRQLRLVGEVMDQKDRAEELIGSIEGIMKDLRERTSSMSNSEKPRVYIGGVSASGSHGIDFTSSKYPPFDFTGSINVVTPAMMNNKTVGQINMEVLPVLDPEIMFIDWGGYALIQQDYVKFKNTLDRVEAIRDGQTYGVLQYNWYATNWESLLANCYYVGKVLYPSAFSDIDPEQKADEIYTQWVGKAIYQQVVENSGGGFQQVSIK